MFTISSAPPTPVSITPFVVPLFSGDTTWVSVQLTSGVPPSGTTIGLSSSNPNAAPVPATIPMQGTHAWTQFQMTAGQVATPAPVTLTATLNGASASGQFTVYPPSLKSITTPSTLSGGVALGAIVMLNGQAPPGGAVVSLSSDNPAASPPSTVTVPSGSYSVPVNIATSAVTTNTSVTITASWQGVSAQSTVTLTPQPVPISLTVFPSWVIGGTGSSQGSVIVGGAAVAYDRYLSLASSHPSITPFLSSYVQIPAGSTRGSFIVLHNAVTVTTAVTISVTGSGVTRSATLTVNPSGTPPKPPPLSSFTVSPSSVAGGNNATGTVTLSSAAPAGGTLVSLSSQIPSAASVPASVTVAAGAMNANFTVTTFPVAPTTVQLSAQLGDTILFSPITINSPAPPPAPGTPPNPPSSGTLPAPSLLSPAADARFSPSRNMTFDWGDVSGAATYTIQIDDSSSFTSPLIVNQTVTTSQFTSSTLPANRMWWRVRANDASGNPGNWSSVRRFELRN